MSQAAATTRFSTALASVVVPAYNQAAYLRACLDALWFQDHPRLEIVVVDDASTDDTRKIINDFMLLTSDTAPGGDPWLLSHAAYAAGDDGQPRERTLQVIAHADNQGLARSLNDGFAACKGQYVTYVPADDLPHPDMIATLALALEDSGADFAYADMLVFTDAGAVLREFKLPDYSFSRSFCDWYLCGDAKLYRRSLHERFGYYDQTLLAHDHELFLRFAMGGAGFVHLARTLFSKRDHGTRQVDIHAPDSWARLIGESKVLVARARAWRDAVKPV